MPTNLCNAQVKLAREGWLDYWSLDYRRQMEPFWREGYDAGWDAAARGEPCPEPYEPKGA